MSERPYIIGIDFDDTICKNSAYSWASSAINGTPFPKVIEAINRLYDEGNYIIIWTARYIKEDLEDVKSFLEKHKIKYQTRRNKKTPEQIPNRICKYHFK